MQTVSGWNEISVTYSLINAEACLCRGPWILSQQVAVIAAANFSRVWSFLTAGLNIRFDIRAFSHRSKPFDESNSVWDKFPLFAHPWFLMIYSSSALQQTEDCNSRVELSTTSRSVAVYVCGVGGALLNDDFCILQQQLCMKYHVITDYICWSHIMLPSTVEIEFRPNQLSSSVHLLVKCITVKSMHVTAHNLFVLPLIFTSALHLTNPL